MDRKINALIIASTDNVAVSIETLQLGGTACFVFNSTKREITLATNVPIYHKFSVTDNSCWSGVVPFQ